MLITRKQLSNTIKVFKVNACLIILMLLISNCKSTKTKNHPPSNAYIEIGSYGGMTGDMDSRRYMNDGSVFRLYYQLGDTLPTTKTLETKLGNSEIHSMFNAFASVDFSKLPPSPPSNITYFIKYNSGTKPSLTFTWGERLDSNQIEVKKIKKYLPFY